MKNLFALGALFVISLLPGNSYGHFTGTGHVHTISQTRQVFSNPNCASTGTCDLKRFALTTSTYEIWFSDAPQGPTYTNGAVMEYETESLDAVERYAIVQFKRGCVFQSLKNHDGRIVTSIGDTVTSFGENIPFCFPHWVIDSQDADPAYNSDPERGRFYYLRWNEPGSYDQRTEKFYGAERPKSPVVYMTDYPGGAFVGGTGVKNVALEFRNCIYKAADVPTQARRDQLGFARPLSCFDWQNIYVYDFAKGSFDSSVTNVPKWEEPPRGINPYLLTACGSILIALGLVAVLARREIRPDPHRGDGTPGLALRFKSQRLRPAATPPLRTEHRRRIRIQDARVFVFEIVQLDPRNLLPDETLDRGNL